MAGITERLRDANAIYFDTTATPQSTTVTSGRIRTGTAGQLGSMIVLVRAVEDIDILDTETIIVKLLDNPLATGGTNRELTSTTITASGATTISAGDPIVEVIVPRTATEYTTVSVGTTSATATGTFDAFLSSPMGRSDV